MQRTTRSLTAALAALAALSFGPTAAGAKTLDVVVAGDDYAAGNGAGPYSDTACGRSGPNWGQKYAAGVRSHGITVNLKNVACTGVKIAELDTQLLQVTPTTDLVALAIGGNDIDFATIVRRCFTPFTSSAAACEAAVTAAQEKLPNLGPSLRALKSRLRPGGKVAVISYPYLASPTDYLLRGPGGATYNAGAAVRSLGETLDFVAANAVDLTNATFRDNSMVLVRTKFAFDGHEPDPNPYRENPRSWIWESTGIASPLDAYRLKPAGHQRIASLLLDAGGVDGDFYAAQ